MMTAHERAVIHARQAMSELQEVVGQLDALAPDEDVAGGFSVARCPEHGLHGLRQECYVCSGPVEQVAVVPVARVRELERALGYLADPENWLGDPHDQTSTLHGHSTPFELARDVLAR